MTSTTTPARYRCTVCGIISTHPADEPDPVCNESDRCGLLFDDERLPEPAAPAAPVARFLKFRLTNIPEGGYYEGDERSYEVLYRGAYLGDIERTWLVAAKEGGEPPAGFCFTRTDGRRGEGLTRAAAVLDAYRP